MRHEKQLIFVSGTGRSGTHLIGRSISSHEKISGRIEAEDTFSLITNIAATQDFEKKWRLFLKKKRVILRLSKVLQKSTDHVLEKSHPSLWLVDLFVKKFNAKFILVYRDVEPTVSSMLEHKGVLTWYERLPLDQPNRFLGITHDNLKYFKEYSLEEKCALRWKSHFDEINRINEKYPSNTLMIKYDDFLINPKSNLEKIASFLKLPNTFKTEDFKLQSLDKWKEKLSDHQLELIRNIL